MIVKLLTKKHKKNYIKALLQLNGIRSADLAREFNVSSAAVSRVISGHSTSKRIRQKISELLNIPYEELWGDCDLNNNKNRGKVNVKS
jgi:transcriptional regulator with XRE-family HTH domain